MDKLTSKGQDLVEHAAIWGAKMRENIIDESHVKFETEQANSRTDGIASLSQRRRAWANDKVSLG